MNINTLRTRYKDDILAIAQDAHVEDIRIFGSVARGDATEQSDIDFLVHPRPDAGFSIGSMQWKLEELLGCKIDIALDTSLHWYIRDRVLSEAVPL